MPDPAIQRMLRAARQRFASAEILHRNQAFHDSMYLAGYVVEIALKAYILAQTPRSKRDAVVDEHFRGAGAHSFDYLWHLIRQRGRVLPVPIAEHLQRIRSWSTDLRYDVGRGDPDDATAYLNSALGILQWVQRSV